MTDSSLKADRPGTRKGWLILGLLFLIGVLNYFDRQTLSILKATLKDVFAFTDGDYSLLIAAFMVPYIIMYVAGGLLIDRLGTRLSMTAFVGFWSLATLFSGLAQSFNQLLASRVMLGAAEPGAFPVMQRAILKWIPERNRAFAFSLVAPSGSAGAMLAPPLVALIALQFGWRAAFIVPAVIGFLVAAIWWRADADPSDRRAKEPARETASLKTLVRERALWGIIAARLISDPVWFFYLFWIPGYLQEARGLTLAELGWVGGIPTLVAAITCIFIGRAIDRRVQGGTDPVTAALTIFAISGAAALLGGTITMVDGIGLALVVITLVTVVCQLWFFLTGVLLAGRFPAAINATAMGIIGAFGATGGLILNLAAGSIIETVGYATMFLFLALAHPLAAAILVATVRRRRPS